MAVELKEEAEKEVGMVLQGLAVGRMGAKMDGETNKW